MGESEVAVELVKAGTNHFLWANSNRKISINTLRTDVIGVVNGKGYYYPA